MAFWSGEKIAQNIKGLFAPDDPNRIDCAAYTLALGPEAFVTTDQRFDDNPERGLKLYLDPGGQCRIPPGQFAFLLTEEVVTVPDSVIAFISMRARYKFKGLVNVSGFHVDPGWKGRLIFAVYNAGPSPVVLSRGSEMFLIWFADLDRTSTSIKRIANPQMTIPDDLTESMSGQVFSPVALSRDVAELKERGSELRNEFSDKHSSLLVELAQLKTDYSFYKKLVIGASLVVFGLIIREFYLYYSLRHDPQSSSAKKERALDSTEAKKGAPGASDAPKIEPAKEPKSSTDVKEKPPAEPKQPTKPVEVKPALELKAKPDVK
ncbi:MAG TPA: hypothetical protein VGK77_28460 [Candidatus Binatia bacterium]|jgi:dCTP deaminase